MVRNRKEPENANDLLVAARKGNYLRFCRVSNSQCGAGVWVVVITSGPYIYVGRTLVECSWKFAEMKNREERFEVEISLAYQENHEP